MNVLVLGAFVLLSLASNRFVRCDEDDERDLAPRYWNTRCTNHQDCQKHEFCRRSYGVWSHWAKHCSDLPKCPGGHCHCHGMKCQSGQCVRSAKLCSSYCGCDLATECCASNYYFRFCAKRPQEGERCCPTIACKRCADGLTCARKWHSPYGVCKRVPTTVKPTTEEDSGDDDVRGLLE